jgi:hypothetical protein
LDDETRRERSVAVLRASVLLESWRAAFLVGLGRGSRRARRASNTLQVDPELLSPDLGPESVYPFASHGCAAAVYELEPPVVEWADDFSVLNPALPERTARVRAAI